MVRNSLAVGRPDSRPERLAKSKTAGNRTRKIQQPDVRNSRGVRKHDCDTLAVRRDSQGGITVGLPHRAQCLALAVEPSQLIMIASCAEKDCAIIGNR